MQRVYERFQDQGFVILAVNATNQDSRAAALAFYEELGLSYPLLFDVDGSVSAAYQLRALPSSFFILPDGRIQEFVIGGPMAEALLIIRVEALLTEAP
jgi:peroxiredoxin